VSGEDILKALASLVGVLAVVGGAILWLARLAVAPLLAAHRAELEKEVDALRAESATLRAEVAELRGAAQPVLRSLERLQHTLERR
jgi:cell division protein FtsB